MESFKNFRSFRSFGVKLGVEKHEKQIEECFKAEEKKKEKSVLHV